MNRSTMLALLMLVSSAGLFSGCVVPADGYYSDPYHRPGVVVVPALPYTVNLYERPYYNYRGYYYFYNNQHWYYSRSQGGNWIELPRTHWPYDTKWKERHFHNDRRDHKYDGHDRRPSKDPKYRSQEDPRRNNKSGQKYDPQRKDPRYNYKHQQKKDTHDRNPQRKNSQRLQKNSMQRDKHRDQMDQRKPNPGKQAMDPRQHAPDKTKQERDNHNQRKVLHHPAQNKKSQNVKNPTEEEEKKIPTELEFKK